MGTESSNNAAGCSAERNKSSRVVLNGSPCDEALAGGAMRVGLLLRTLVALGALLGAAPARAAAPDLLLLRQ